MKLVTFNDHHQNHIGAQVEKKGELFLVDLCCSEPGLPKQMRQLISGGESALNLARAVSERSDAKMVPQKTVRLLAPVPDAGKIICLGLNYRAHAEEGGRQAPEFPTLFSKYANTIAGPYDEIILPKISNQVDYEVELACVIGRKGKHITEADAFDYIVGYLVLNDVSARDYQWRTTQWLAGKTFDGFAPMGPALVTKDEIPNPGSLDLWLTLNGNEMQRSNTSDLIFTIPYLISYISRIMTLEPGDIISTGTPSGVGAFRKPPVFLKAGDVVSASVEKIGSLVNQVVDEV